MESEKKLIIFDLDGTLYKLQGGSYGDSFLRQKVISNAKKYIAEHLGKKEVKEIENIFSVIEDKYGEDISLGLEKEYGLDRYDYFNVVWNIPAKDVVETDPALGNTLATLSQNFTLSLLSDAPKIWISNVLKELDIERFFVGYIFSGEGDRRKGFGNAFSSIVAQLGIDPKNCISVGDQDRTDIIPAKEAGMRTIFVQHGEPSTVADINIEKITDLSPEMLKFLKQ